MLEPGFLKNSLELRRFNCWNTQATVQYILCVSYFVLLLKLWN